MFSARKKTIMQCHRVLLFLLVLCLGVSPALGAYTITEFCPDGYTAGDGDEYVIIDGSGSLAGWTLSDGEGTIILEGSGKTVIARSGEAYFQMYQTYPDFEIIGDSAAADAKVSGRFQMANAGDSLTLSQNGIAIQTVSWPENVAAGNGRVHRLEDGIWDTRVYKIGQSDFECETFSVKQATLFVSPDCSHEVITKEIEDAGETILISMYEFTSLSLAESLAEAEARGVEVTLLIEGGPVGGMSEEEKGVLNYLSKNGADVFTIESEGNFPARYRFLHTKYLILDGETAITLSENFKDSGVPESRYGNRGWGAAIEDSSIAEYFEEVFFDDLSGYDIYRWRETADRLPEYSKAEKAAAVFQPKTVTNIKVTPVIAPDTSYLIGEALDTAKSAIDIQQAYISHYSDTENPWLVSAIAAAERGADVRIQLDGMYYNTDSDADNDEIAASVNRLGRENLHAKILTDREGILKLHNKGFIIDENIVLISSINWNYNSPTNNREAGVLIESEEAAAYYTKVFEYDWEGIVLEDPVSISVGFDIRILAAVGIIAGFACVFIWRRRR